jgi:Zn-dependent metalloprotease
MPANSTFSTARAATIRAAQDLHGANSAVERALVQAWTAVGVN